MSDIKVREKGFNILFRELGEVETIRFLSQITYEKRSYIDLQEELFKGMNVDEIYERAKEYQEGAGNVDKKYLRSEAFA
ncbi:MAG: hypothetical protein HY755_12835 [Nitrospirae bacterium]|nr:hypothetical protein [Nitrospirota bacterium]